jgi:co-chaperonin GroES (HSP10)
MYLQPRGARVIVKRKIVNKRGSLFIPTNSQEMRFNLGEVEICGPDVSEDIQKGDLITFGRYAPVNLDRTEMEEVGLKLDKDCEYLLLNEDDILCHVLSEDAEETREVA